MASSASNTATCIMARPRPCAGGLSRFSVAMASARVFQSTMTSACARPQARSKARPRTMCFMFPPVGGRHSIPVRTGRHEEAPKVRRNRAMVAPIMSRPLLLAALLAGLVVLPVMAATPPASPGLRLGIKGYDPVAYFTLQRATPGQAQFEYSWDEHVWHFASAAHLEMFKADPVR